MGPTPSVSFVVRLPANRSELKKTEGIIKKAGKDMYKEIRKENEAVKEILDGN